MARTFRVFGALALALISSLSVGCASQTLIAERAPGVDPANFHTYYVRKFTPDNRGIEKVISDRLTAMGHTSTCGTDEKAPGGVDVLVTYQDKWMWDLSMYMLQLDIVFRDPATEAVLVSGMSNRTSLVRAPKDKMVEEVLAKMFEKQ